MKITKREISVSVIIVAIMVTLGFILSSKINESISEKQKRYETSVQIESEDQFKYCLETEIGNSLSCGTIQAIDTVTYPELNGEYSYINKIKEKYTKHKRTETYTDSDGETKTRTEIYYTWDKVDEESKHSNKLLFLGCVFKYDEICLPYENHIDTIYENKKVRYQYYVKYKEYTGTLYSYMRNKNIENACFYDKMTIGETIKDASSKFGLYFFWIFWIFLIVIIVYKFYEIDNDWLEN